MELEKLSKWEAGIVRIGIFAVFVVTYADYVFHKLWSVLGPLLGGLRR